MKGALALRGPVGAPPAVLNTTSVNVTAAAWVEIVSNLSFGCSAVLVTNGGAEPLSLGKGAAASEVATGAVIPPSQSLLIPIEIAKGSRLALRSLGGTQSSGYVTMAFLG